MKPLFGNLIPDMYEAYRTRSRIVEKPVFGPNSREAKKLYKTSATMTMMKQFPWILEVDENRLGTKGLIYGADSQQKIANFLINKYNIKEFWEPDKFTLLSKPIWKKNVRPRNKVSAQLISEVTGKLDTMSFFYKFKDNIKGKRNKVRFTIRRTYNKIKKEQILYKKDIFEHVTPIHKKTKSRVTKSAKPRKLFFK